MIEDYVLTGFFCSVVHFPQVVTPFFPDYRRHVFFSSVRVSFLCSTVHTVVSTSSVSFQTKPPRLPVPTSRQKGSHYFNSRGSFEQQPPTTPLPVSLSTATMYVTQSINQSFIF